MDTQNGRGTSQLAALDSKVPAFSTRHESFKSLTPSAQKPNAGFDGKRPWHFWSVFDSQGLCRRHFIRCSPRLSLVDGVKIGRPGVHFTRNEGNADYESPLKFSGGKRRIGGAMDFIVFSHRSTANGNNSEVIMATTIGNGVRPNTGEHLATIRRGLLLIQHEPFNSLTLSAQKTSAGFDGKNGCPFWSVFDSQELCRRHFIRCSRQLSLVDGGEIGRPGGHFTKNEGNVDHERPLRFSDGERRIGGAMGLTFLPSLRRKEQITRR